MIGTVVFNYIFGRMIDSPRFSNHSKLWTAAAVIINLVLLGIFKYTDFFINTVNSLFDSNSPDVHQTSDWNQLLYFPIYIVYN